MDGLWVTFQSHKLLDYYENPGRLEARRDKQRLKNKQLFGVVAMYPEFSYSEENMLSYTVLGGMKHYLMERLDYELNEYDEMVLVNRQTFIESMPLESKPVKPKAVDAVQLALNI